MELVAHGLRADTPQGWDGQITRRATPDQDQAAQRLGGSGRTERTFPVLHLANIPLPAERGDYGGGVTPLLGPTHVFLALFEHGPDAVGTPLFAAEGLPRNLTPRQFRANMLARALPGQAGFQHFFTDNGRAFCLYIVLGGRANAATVVPQVNRALSAIVIDPA